MMFITPVHAQYQILDIDRTSVFAGRLGHEVRETWHVRGDSGEFTVIVMPYHDHVAGTKTYQVGDRVSISSAQRGKTIRVTIGEVKK